MIKTHLFRIIIGCLLGLGLAVAQWRMSPRVYAASAQIYVNGSGRGASGGLDDVLGVAGSQPLSSEGAILHSEGAFRQAVENVAVKRGDDRLLDRNVQSELFEMYDIQGSGGSKVMLVSMRAYDPQLAADIANELVNAYNKIRQDATTRGYASAQSLVGSRLANTTRELSDAEERLKKFKESMGVLDVEGTVGAVASYQVTLHQQLDSANLERASLLQTLEKTKKEIPNYPVLMKQSISQSANAIMLSLKTKIADLEGQRTNLLVIHAPTSTKVAQIDAMIKNARKQMEQEARRPWEENGRSLSPMPIRSSFESNVATGQVQLVAIDSRIKSLQTTLDKQDKLAATLPGKQKAYGALLRDRDVFRENYTNQKRQLEQLRMASNEAMEPATMLFAAEPNYKPVSPQAGKTLPVGFIMGGIFGLLLSFARESLRSTARSSQEVAAMFELPVVATVPMLNESAVQKRLASLPDPGYAPTESFRFMASALALPQKGSRRVLFTSVGGNVGCSSAAGEFAVAAAKMGISTILVDADLKYGTITKSFKMGDKPGLRDILSRRLLGTGDAPLAERTEHRYLSIVPVGSGDESGPVISDTPLQILSGLLDSLQEQADLIVVDCPPIDVLADASRFVPIVEEVCLVVSARKTSLQAISLSRALLERCGARAVNVVLTGTAPKEEAFMGVNHYTANRR